MSWHDLLFAHWPVPADVLRPHIPQGLELDTADGRAWIGIVPFHMTGVRPRLPAPPLVSRFPEMNVRTYVVHDDKPGVWFFSLDARSRLAVQVARWWFCLPYHYARIEQRRTADGWIGYRSQRCQRGAPAAGFAARYRPVGDVFESRPGQLEHFLTARYCLYARHRSGELTRADIDHAPWRLQAAEVEIEHNTMLEPYGLQDPGPPVHLLFARRVDALSWAARPVR